LKNSYLVLILCLAGIKSNAQEVNSVSTPEVKIGKSLFHLKTTRDFSRKGDFTASWGYNVSWYGKSDIRFRGPNYDFTLKNVVAHDRQSKFGRDFLNPSRISIPQYNLRFGYYISDKYSISIGWDHMKYVVDIPQRVQVFGVIGETISSPAIPTGSYAGNYNGETIDLKADMLRYEHTDGFNYLSSELQRDDDIWVSKSRKRTLTMETGAGLGMFIPRSDVHLFGVGANHYWNVAGYGFSVKAGLKYFITRGLYLQNSTKFGFSNLTEVYTTGRNDLDKASQKINYMENYTILGYHF
jgi:hypothetical protein